MKGACPCGVVFLRGDVERDLRAHVVATHPEELARIERHTSMRKAWEAINRGVPVLVTKQIAAAAP